MIASWNCNSSLAIRFKTSHTTIACYVISCFLIPFVFHGATAQELSPKRAEEAYQVTAMTILAEKGTGETDPKLATVNGRLMQILPGHYFRLVEGRTSRLEPGQSFAIKAAQESVLTVALNRAMNEDGKVQLDLVLKSKNQEQFETVVKTPPNQLFFIDQKMSDSQRQLIAVGAR